MLKLHLPPNLAAAAARNAIPIRVEFDSAEPLDTEILPALALLQKWCATPMPPRFIQLSREQLREIANAAGGQPIFVENGQLAAWRHPNLLAEPASAVPEAPSPEREPPRRHSKPGIPEETPVVVDGSEHFLAISPPSKEDPRYSRLVGLLKDNGFVLELSNRKWWLRDRHRTLQFLATHGGKLRDTFAAQFTDNFQRNTAKIRHAGLDVSVREASGGYEVTLGLQAGAAGEPGLRDTLTSGRAYVESGGNIVLLDSESLEKLSKAQRALSGNSTAALAAKTTERIPASRAAEVTDIIESLSPNFRTPDSWRLQSAPLRDLATLEAPALPADLTGQLRPYQRLGIAWLRFLDRHRLGGILADEMGLGKTLQALGFLAALKESDRAAPSRSENSGTQASLVVCPASLIENWRREAAHFTPQLRVFVHHGERRIETTADLEAFDLAITSYGTLTRDVALFSSIEFRTVIADEAQHIKNRRSQNAAALRSLRARSRFLLTGTPLENSLDDLRSLMEFLLPGYVTRLPPGLRGDERSWHDDRLRAQAAPYILRRTKSKVAPELPEKIEQIVWCDLSPAQSALYREFQERSEREIFDLEAAGAGEAKLKFTALTHLLRLRQICCDPRLVVPDAPATDSAKLDSLGELLAEALDDGHRVLVFSQFTSLLDLLRAELDQQQIAHCHLDGSMPVPARQAEIDRFQSSSDIPLFLLSLKAGGTGLNLTGADTVVHFDPWWNPSVEAQATDRAHRIGQTRVVTSYKLIAAGTVEEKVLALQAEKRALLAGVLEASDAASARLSLDDLKALLQH